MIDIKRISEEMREEIIKATVLEHKHRQKLSILPFLGL